jgi:hypothetical protein
MRGSVTGFSKWFGGQMDQLKGMWTSLINWVAQNPIGKSMVADFQDANSRLAGYVGKLVPGFAKAALDQAKKEREAREAAAKIAAGGTTDPKARPDPKDSPDTSGLGKQPREDPSAKLLAGLKERLEASKALLAVAGQEEIAQRKVAAANAANNDILKLGEEIAKSKSINTSGYTPEKYIALVDAKTQATIRASHADEEETTTLAALGNAQGANARATAFSISQSGLMVEAIGKGTTAIARQSAFTQAWTELHEKGASALQVLARADAIFAEGAAKESVTIGQSIVSLQQEAASLGIVTNAMLGNSDARDQAALQAKLYILDQQIAHPLSAQNLIDLKNQRVAISDVAEAQNRQRDAQAALSLLSPAEQYANKKDNTDSAVAALVALKAQSGEVLNYGEQLQIAAKRQEEFDQKIDETVSNLLRQGTAMDGVTAFFDDMQKQAITTGKIIYDALHQAFDGIADNFTKLITGQKTDFAKMLKDIGTQMVNSTIKQAMGNALGPLGKALGITGKADGSQSNPFYTKSADGMAGGAHGAVGGALSGLKGIFGKMFGKGDGGADASDFDGTAGGTMDEGDVANGGSGGGLGAMGGGLKGLLGGLFKGASATAPDGTQANPFYILNALEGLTGDPNSQSGDPTGGLLSSFFKKSGSGSGSDGGSDGGGFSGFLSSLFGGGSSGGASAGDSSDFAGGLASGGPVSPSSAYLVGEHGPEILSGASGAITSNAASSRMLNASSGTTANYTIDARGTDPVLTEQRTRAAIMAAHSSAITTGMQLSAERLKRVPPAR